MALAPYDITPTATQQEMIDFILSRGWTVDTSKTVNTFRGWGFNQLPADEQAGYWKQNPFTFTRIGSDGGTQTLRLGHRSRSGEYPHDYAPFGKTLREAYFTWAVPGTDRIRRITIRQPRSYHGPDHLWEALAVTGPKTPIRQRVARFVADPEQAIAKAEELQEAYRVAQEQALLAREADREARETLPEGWEALQAAAQAVAASDGLSDHAALLAQLQAAVAAVEDVVVVR